ncbi:MAG: signal peptidase II [Pseudomonadota bacterium]
MRLVAIFTVFAALLDQISKYVVIHAMNLAQIRAIDVLPPLLNFRYGENRGINFGMFGDGTSRWVFVGLAVVICAVVLWWLRGNAQPRIALMSAGLLIGGALGNVIDRLLYGYVLDFLNMSCCGIQNPFVFNVADIFIFAGAIGLVLFAQDGGTGRKKRA